MYFNTINLTAVLYKYWLMDINQLSTSYFLGAGIMYTVIYFMSQWMSLVFINFFSLVLVTKLFSRLTLKVTRQ